MLIFQIINIIRVISIIKIFLKKMGPTISLNKAHNSYKSDSKQFPKNISKSQKKETLFILDWDDTLMCTSFVSSKTQSLSEEDKNIIINLGKIVSIFLKECLKYGKIIIMTNSSERWMKKTAQNYLKIKNDIFENIKIISTRDRYYKKGIEVTKWKEMASEEILLKYGDKIENLICGSDSENDIEVFKNISKKYININISTIKFKTKPSPSIMIKEIEYLNKRLYEIIGTNKNYYLIIEKPKKDNYNFSYGYLLDYIF